MDACPSYLRFDCAWWCGLRWIVGLGLVGFVGVEEGLMGIYWWVFGGEWYIVGFYRRFSSFSVSFLSSASRFRTTCFEFSSRNCRHHGSQNSPVIAGAATSMG